MHDQRLVILLVVFMFSLAGCSVAGLQQADLSSSWVESTPLVSSAIQDSSPVPTSAEVVLPVSATSTLIPTSTSAPLPTARPVLVPLTSGGCCVQPFWSPDGQRIYYIDRPNTDTPSGLWSVGVEGGAPEFYSDLLGIYSADMQLRTFLQSGQTVVENLSTGERWVVPSGGRAVSFSPDGLWLAWTAGQSDPPLDRALREIWISRSDGTQARRVAELTGGGFGGWFPDGRLLLSERLQAPESGQVIWAVTLDENKTQTLQMVELGRSNRLRDMAISPDGNYVAYMASFNEDASQDGIWVVDSFSGEKYRLELFGAYQWRDESRLLVIPLDLTEPLHRILQVDAGSGQIQELTDTTVTAFKVANGDWSVSPDGGKIVFVSAADRNIWLLSLPANH